MILDLLALGVGSHGQVLFDAAQVVDVALQRPEVSGFLPETEALT